MQRWPTALICLISACSSPRGSSRAIAVAAALDSLVPGARIGAVAAPVAQRFNLQVAAYVGYEGKDYRAPMGVRGVALQVNESLESESDRPSRSARIKGVVLAFASAAGVDSTLAFLTRQIGPPDPYCYTPAYKPQRSALYFWPDKSPYGVLLVMRTQDPLQSFVAFGALEPNSNSSFEGALTPGRCDAA